MPLTLTLTEGVLPADQEKIAFARLSDAMLKWHGQADNAALKRNIVGSIQLIPPAHTYAGSRESSVAFVEWKVPAFLFATREIQMGYIAEATDIIHEMSGKQHPRDHIWVNVVHAVDGAWGIAGMALTNQQLTESAG